MTNIDGRLRNQLEVLDPNQLMIDQNVPLLIGGYSKTDIKFKTHKI